jgi:hypothetical protein
LVGLPERIPEKEELGAGRSPESRRLHNDYPTASGARVACASSRRIIGPIPHIGHEYLRRARRMRERMRLFMFPAVSTIALKAHNVGVDSRNESVFLRAGAIGRQRELVRFKKFVEVWANLFLGEEAHSRGIPVLVGSCDESTLCSFAHA